MSSLSRSRKLTVRRQANASLPVQPRRASAQYFDSRIGVGVARMTTSDAFKNRLALAALGVNDSTCGTGLRGVGGGNFDKVPTPFLDFVFQEAGEHAPALFEDGAVQAAFPSTRSGHLYDFEVLDSDPSITSRNRGAGSMRPVLARASRLRPKRRDTARLLRPPVRSTLSAAKRPLKALFPFCVSSWSLECLSSGERDRVCDAAIYPDLTTRNGLFGRFNFARKTDAPLSVCLGYGDVHDMPDRSRVSELHPPQLWQTNGAPLPVQRFNADVPPIHADASTVAPLTESWVSRAAMEGVKRPLQVAHSEDQARRWHRRNPRSAGTKVFQFRALREPADVLALNGLEPPPVIAPLFKGQIVNSPRCANPMAQRLSLRGGWIKAVAVAPKHLEILA